MFENHLNCHISIFTSTILFFFKRRFVQKMQKIEIWWDNLGVIFKDFAIHFPNCVEKWVLLSQTWKSQQIEEKIAYFEKEFRSSSIFRPSWWFDSWEVCLVLFSDGFRLGEASDVDGMAKADFPLRLVDFKGWESMQRCRATLGQILQQRPWQSQEKRKEILHLAGDDQVLWTGL